MMRIRFFSPYWQRNPLLGMLTCPSHSNALSHLKGLCGVALLAERNVSLLVGGACRHDLAIDWGRRVTWSVETLVAASILQVCGF